MKHGALISALALGLLGISPLQSDVTHIERSGDNHMYDVTNDPWQPDGFEGATAVPASFVEMPQILLDGRDNEMDWERAVEVEVPLTFGLVRTAWIKALYSNDEVFLRIRWEDATEDRVHRPWVWNAEQGRYEEGSQVEDSVIVSIEAGCWWAPSFLEGYVFDFDGWRWLAARSDPVGQAVDIDGSVQDRDLTSLGFVQYQSRNAGDVWNLKFTEEQDDSFYKTWEQLDRTYLHQPSTGTVYYRGFPDGLRAEQIGRKLSPPEVPPAEGESGVVAQYEAVPFDGDAGEVGAKGQWEDGYWTVEFRRTLVTPSETTSDSVFNRLTQFSIHVFDHVERIDQSSESGRLFLQFMKPEDLVTMD